MFFVIIALDINLMLKSALATAFTLGLSISSLVYRGKVEDKLLRKKFGEEWENYAGKVGFLFPKLRKQRTEV